MNVDVRFRNLKSSSFLRAHATRSAHSHLGRFGQAMRSVTVRIGDLNGPRGGLDKRCQVTIRGPRIPLLAVEEVASDAYAAVDLAMARIKRTVSTTLAKARDAKVGGDRTSRRRRPPAPAPAPEI